MQGYPRKPGTDHDFRRAGNQRDSPKSWSVPDFHDGHVYEGAYPFVVEEGGARYLVTGNRLYRALDFPRRWALGPAGRLYWRSGALYRPAEICVPREGAGVALHRVLRLTPHEYAERHVETLPGLRCVNRAGSVTVVDVVSRRRRFA